MTFTLEQTQAGVDLVVVDAWSAEAKNALVGGRADGLVLNYARGFKERDLEFLRGLPVRRLHILARTLTDLSPVYSLADELVSLRVQSAPHAVIELERLPHLRTLSATWGQVQGSLRFAQGLEHLYLLSYTEPDLTALTSIPTLVSVNMKDYPRVRSLDGVDELPRLAELGIHVARELTEISALQRAPSGLETLQLASCRRIDDITAVAACTSLRFLDLSEGGHLPSIEPLAKLERVERLHLYGSTTVVDGDLGPIARLPRLRDFRMQSRRFYRPSVKEIQDAIAHPAGD